MVPIITRRMPEHREQPDRVLPEARAMIMRIINLVPGAVADKARQALMEHLARLEKVEMVLHLQYQELLQIMQVAAAAVMSVLQVLTDLGVLVVQVVVAQAPSLLQIFLLQMELQRLPIQVAAAAVQPEAVVVLEGLAGPVL